MRRRDVLKIGAGAAAAGALPTITWAGASVSGFVADLRFPIARAAATPVGAWRHDIDGDVTLLWYDRLDRDWRTAHGSVAGITGEDALFVLERLAWDRGRRVVRRDRLAADSAPLVRWIIAPRGARA